MRSIFDQYKHPENRLTHALACCLNEDRKLLRHFIAWVTGKQLSRIPRHLEIVEQQLPGEGETLTEEEAEDRGLPDAWIHDGEEWSLIIESKVAAPLSNDQLIRHNKTALKRGYEDIQLLAICVIKPGRKLPMNTLFKKWLEVYSWLIRQSAYSEWASRMARYIEAAEAKMTIEGYLKEGTMTVFSGIPFNDKNPYTYIEAKRILSLAMEQLRQRKDLRKMLQINYKSEGRKAITGKNRPAVWDYIPFRQANDNSNFTNYPHLTLGIEQSHVAAILIVPNSIKSQYRQNILKGGKEQFLSIFEEINANITKSLRKAEGAVPYVELVQRHYKTQSSKPIIDARLTFDMCTAFDSKMQKNRGVKLQPVWLKSVYDVWSKKKANIQLGVGAKFPYDSCHAVRTSYILDHISQAWISCRPLIKALLG